VPHERRIVEIATPILTTDDLAGAQNLQGEAGIRVPSVALLVIERWRVVVRLAKNNDVMGVPACGKELSFEPAMRSGRSTRDSRPSAEITAEG
jgi:hypothetical protein